MDGGNWEPICLVVFRKNEIFVSMNTLLIATRSRITITNASSISYIKKVSQNFFNKKVVSMLINQNPLQRGELNDTAFQALLDRADDSVAYLVSHQGKPVCRETSDGGGSFAHIFFTRSQLPVNPSLTHTDKTHIYMGARGKQEYVAIEVEDPAPYVGVFPGSIVRSLRDVSEGMIDGDAVSLMAHATGISTWHYRTRHCVKCGSPLMSHRSGNARKCTNTACGVSSYPRIEPAVIQLVQSPCHSYALLGRKAIWPKGRYSCLAGFVEVGETLEQCVVRETEEEAGVPTHLESVQYKRSQPWPFPSSLMLGYFATAVGDVGVLPTVKVQESEMEDVRWVSRAELQAALGASAGSTSLDKSIISPLPPSHAAAGGSKKSVTGKGRTQDGFPLSLPGTSSLARSLLSEWAFMEDGTES